jgi:SNF2 family DNA or RNA helicase
MTAFPDVLISTYHKLSGWADVLAGRVKSVVFDEAQELRISESAKYKAAAHIARAADFRTGLTATPIYNYGGEMFCVLDVLRPGALGSRAEFVREWCRQWGESVRDPKAFGTYLRSEGLMLRRTRAEVGRELPPLTKIVQRIDAEPEALDRVQGSASELAKLILAGMSLERGKKLRAAEELSLVLRQATGIAKAPFVAEFVRLLVESGEKVLLYGWHRAVYDIWLERLRDLSPALYTGSESPKQKDEAKARFLDPDGAKVLIMSLRAGAGVDGIQKACRTVVFGELDWSPGVHEQCCGRPHRDGQTDPVAAYFLAADRGSDPVVADVLGLKKAQIEGVRDPDGDLIERLDTGAGHITKLAEAYLRQRGIALPEPSRQEGCLA